MNKTLLKIKNSGEKIFKILVLLGIREFYLFFRNWYGMIVHPFLTLERIAKQKDYSQTILLFSFPFGIWFGWILILLISRLLIGGWHFGFLAKASFVVASLFTFAISFFLFYWGIRVIKRRIK